MALHNKYLVCIIWRENWCDTLPIWSENFLRLLCKQLMNNEICPLNMSKFLPFSTVKMSARCLSRFYYVVHGLIWVLSWIGAKRIYHHSPIIWFFVVFCQNILDSTIWHLYIPLDLFTCKQTTKIVLCINILYSFITLADYYDLSLNTSMEVQLSSTRYYMVK